MRKTTWRAGSLSILIAACLTMAAPMGVAEERSRAGEEEAFSVGSDVALSSLISLSDGHIQELADSLYIVAATDAARSGDWEQIRPYLAAVSERSVAALNWFALPDGSYWSVQNGREDGNLAARDYFPQVLAGNAVTGDLVVSRATGKPVAIVAVPIERFDGSVIGVLGSSVYLDQLSAQIGREMGLSETEIFYSFDETPIVALAYDSDLVFFEPLEAGDRELATAFMTMLQSDSGTVTYTFRGRERTVVYRRSDVTGWWYAFGIVEEESDRPETPVP